MKHQPIVNPHARIGQIVKKTKAEEKDELIATTKSQVIEKYGQSKKNIKQRTKDHIGGPEDDEQRSFQLEDKVDKRFVGV